MKIVIQRVSKASVSVNDTIIGSIDIGMCLLVGICREDTIEDVNKVVPKILRMKLWNEGDTGWKKNVQDINGGILAISQFTLHARTNKAKPDFHDAMKSEDALLLYNSFIDSLKSMHPHVETGAFGQMMAVEIHNDGPVTMIIDSKE